MVTCCYQAMMLSTHCHQSQGRSQSTLRAGDVLLIGDSPLFVLGKLRAQTPAFVFLPGERLPCSFRARMCKVPAPELRAGKLLAQVAKVLLKHKFCASPRAPGLILSQRGCGDHHAATQLLKVVLGDLRDPQAALGLTVHLATLHDSQLSKI